MPKVIAWSPDKQKRELSQRLEYAKENRKNVEYRWEENERTVFNTKGGSTNPYLSESFESDIDLGLEDIDNSDSSINVNYTFKNLRFIHAQLSANPPSVVTRPTSSDQSDRSKADAADRVVRYLGRQYRLQELVDRASLNTLVYGSGFMKTIWDSTKGDILEFDEESGELTLEGDFSITVPSSWNLYVDPDAERWEDVRYVYERVLIPYEEAVFRWPGEANREVIEANRLRTGEQSGNSGGRVIGTTSSLSEEKYDAVELYEYWEKGLPTNGFLGRFATCDKSGNVLGELTPNPFRFRPPGSTSEIESNDHLSDEEKDIAIRKIPQIAALPYHLLTDIDIPDKVWGRSFVEYCNRIQDVLQRCDSTVLDNIAANGVNRLVLPENAEISDESMTNSPWDIVRIAGNQGPWFMEAAGPLPAVDAFRSSLKAGIDDISGVNEAMFGQQSRETSGFGMQYATQQGNMIRRRLFNKYVIFVEDIYRALLNLVRKHWDTDRTIFVLGKEKSLEAVDLQGADINGGYDIVVEYGASLSLDPMTRREEILSLQPLFEKAGVPPRVALQMMKLNELEGLYDLTRLAEDRQREIFEVIIATGRQIQPEPMQDHENMIAYALRYFMTTEFFNLTSEQRDLCRQHIQLRAALAATESAPTAGTPGAAPPGPMPPGPAPTAAPPPAPAEMTGDAAAISDGEGAPTPEFNQ